MAIASIDLISLPAERINVPFLAGLGIAAILLCILVLAALRRWRGPLTDTFVRQAEAMDALSERRKASALLVLAGLSLLLELAMIRWLAALFPFFSFYKNFVLLACFMGLGVGYAMSQDRTLALPVVAPLMTWLMILLLFVRNGMDPELSYMVRNLIPFTDQLHMGIVWVGRNLVFFLASHFFFAVVFLLTALIFVPIGQACGRLMEHFPKLRGYGLNLLGSILGMLAMFVAGLFWLPPFAWFSVCFMVVLAYQQFDRKVLVASAVAVIAGLMVLSYPWNRVVHEIYSPYQLIERVGSRTGLMRILAGGTSYQEVFDYSFGNSHGRRQRTAHGQADYYEFPYEVQKNPRDVLILGAGTGNDVAAGLRMGAGHIDAVEIDPTIVALGRAYHPEKPYDSRRVAVHVNDARTFMRNTDKKYGNRSRAEIALSLVFCI